MPHIYHICTAHVYGLQSVAAVIRRRFTSQETRVLPCLVMMKLILSLTVLWLLSSTAGALQCEGCTGQCLSPQPINCPSETHCISFSMTIDGVLTGTTFRGCAPSPVCHASGNHTLSASVGIMTATAECCDTDSCNTGTVTYPGGQSDNELKCFSCTPGTTECNSIVQCKGVENRCFQASFTVPKPPLSTSVPVKGCMSDNVCSAVSSLPSSFDLQFTDASCCKTSLCNTAPTPTSATTVYLLFGFIYIFY